MTGVDFILLDKVDSTNTYARKNFSSLPDGCVVAAVEQTAGRGRLGRQWFSGKDLSVTATAVLKNISVPFHAGVVVGLAGLELVRECVPHAFSFFKWPNDIYIRDCKIAGILSEGVLKNGKLQGVAAGIGINVNNDTTALRVNGIRAISLQEVSKQTFFVEKLRIELAKKIKKYYIMCQSNPDGILTLWRQENRLIGEQLVLDLPSGESKQGRFLGITDSGVMQLEDANGGVFCFDCGDVKIDTSLIDFNSLKEKYMNEL